jgi:hypothetical protein
MKAIYTILIMLMSTMLSINMAGAKTFMLPALPYTYDALEP